MRLRFLKQQSIFLIGFGIGFVPSLLLFFWRTIPVTEPTYNQESWQPEYYSSKKPYRKEIILQHWKEEKRTSDIYFNGVTYNAWLAAQNLKFHNVDLDKYVYRSRQESDDDTRKIESMEWDWLSRKVSVACVVLVEKLKLAKSIQATWGKRCNNIYFFGHNLIDTELPVININMKIVSSWQLLCEVMNYIWNDRAANKLEWIIFVKDSTMIIPENLRYIVAPLDYRDDHYLGHPVVMWGQSYNVAQSGYVLSKGTLAKVVQMFNTSEKCIKGGKYWKKEDYYLGKHLLSLGIRPSDTRDQYLRGTFHGYSIKNLLWGVTRPDSYWTHALYPMKGTCCSPISVTFGVSEADKMHMLNYLLYHLRVFIGEGRFGTVPAKVPVPEEDVWKIALEEEFNISHLSEISSEAYYAIWHAKYSEPGQLKAAKYNKMTSNALNCLLESYNVKNKSTKDCAAGKY